MCWHKFGKWSDPYQVEQTRENYGEAHQHKINIQVRVCEKCNIVDTRTAVEGAVIGEPKEAKRLFY